MRARSNTAARRTGRGTLRSMKSSDRFRDFALDQLSAIPDVRARAMFGGIGIYSGDIFFGLIANDVLYLKVDDSNRGAYEAQNSAPFRPYPDRPMTMPYYNVPVGVLEDPRELTIWARASIRIAASGAARRRSK
jgi:DNA transformation protein and related proteins